MDAGGSKRDLTSVGKTFCGNQPEQNPEGLLGVKIFFFCFFTTLIWEKNGAASSVCCRFE